MKQKPYNLLLWTGLSIVLASMFLFGQNKAIDVHLHDTYFVIAHKHVFWVLAIVALLIWALYLLTSKILYSTILTWAHVIITIITLLLFAALLFTNAGTRRYYDYSNWNSLNNHITLVKAIAIAVVVLLNGQFIFIINIVAGLIKRRA